ncbi:uncharacterized protein LOC129535236 isoform X2 [Moschus berezovskii]|uniref:uncharacterized protein LOC129535236 isoform X2 n=1 Tax=Moschus berezovskii TaxID=68408 RepID=UPI002443C92B|nr:uncharacterized protein LOC129535236 isoform X2 [Moschus berezovskii]
MTTLAQTSGLSPQPAVDQGLPSLEEGQGLGLHGRPAHFAPARGPEGESSPQPPAPKKDGRRDGGGEGADTEQSAGSHTDTHTAGQPVSIRCPLRCDPSRPACSAPPVTRLRCRIRSVVGGHPSGGSGVLAWWAGVAPPLRLTFFPAPPLVGRNYAGPGGGGCGGIKPILAVTLRHPRRERSELQPAHPLPGLAQQRRKPDSSLLFYPHGERWEAREELRPEWEADHRDPAPAKGVTLQLVDCSVVVKIASPETTCCVAWLA